MNNNTYTGEFLDNLNLTPTQRLNASRVSCHILDKLRELKDVTTEDDINGLAAALNTLQKIRDHGPKEQTL